MNTDNPYQSPESSAEGDTNASDTGANVCTIRPPYAWTACVIFIALGFLFFLDGQVFTNTLVFLGLMALSAFLWVPLLVWAKPNHRRFALWVICGHVILIVFFASGLPELHRRQQKFNNVRDQLRQGTHGQTPGK